MEIQMQKFIPEGWDTTQENFNLRQLQTAKREGTVLQGFVSKCDENYNLQIQFGNGICRHYPKK